MANKKIQATATLFLDTKDAQNDAKKFVNDLKQKLSDIETAADKMTVFKDMVSYIAQVDRALAALRAKNGDAFNSMFDGLDANLKKQFEDLFGVDGGKFGQLDVLREKFNTLTPESGIKEIRDFAREINQLATELGVKVPFADVMKDFSKGTKTEYIEKLSGALADFAIVWKDVNARVSQGFGGTGGDLGNINQKIKKEVDSLDNLKKIVKKKVKEFYDEFTIGSNDDDKLDAIQDSLKDALSLSDKDFFDISGIFADLKYGDIEEDEAIESINKIVETIKSGAKEIKSATETISGDTDLKEDINKSIELLKQQLQTVHDAGKNIGDHELGFVVDVDGATYFIESCENIVKASDEAAVAVRALNENMTIMGHTHPDGGGQFSAGDYISMINQRRAGMVSPSMVMGDKYASILNLVDATDDVLTQIENVLRRHGKSGDDAVGANIISEMQEIFSANGMPDALQIIKVADNMDELATSLYNMGSAASTVQSPLQKLQSLIKYYSGNKLGSGNLSEFNDYWSDFESGAKSATIVFDEVMSKLGATDLEGNPFDTNSKQYQALGAALKLINTEASNTSVQVVDEMNQKLREQEQLWENVKIAIKNGIGEVVGIDNMAIALEVIENEIKEGILASLEECIARFKELNNISEEDSLEFVGKRERVIEDRYDTYLPGYNEVVNKEEADKLRQLSFQQEQLYHNLRLAIKSTLSDVVDVDDMTYAFDTIEKEIEAGLLTTLDQCIAKFKLLIGLDDEKLTSIRDDQRVADYWDYYRGNQYVGDDETVINSSEYNKFLNERAELLERISSLQSKIDGMPDTYFTEGDFESSVQEYCVEIDKLQNELAELKVSYEVLKDVNQFATEDLVDYEREVANLNKIIEDLQIKLSSKTGETGTGVDSTNAIGDNSLTSGSEIAQLELLQNKLIEVKTAVDAKTQAFEEEYVTVDAAVAAEIESLNKLKDLLVEIQGILQTVFSVGGMNLGEIELSQGKENINTTSTAIQGIQQTLQQILAVLQGFTGLEADGKNSITHKESTAKAPVNNANATEHLAGKLNDLATEGTLLKIPAAIDELADAIGNKTKAESDTHLHTINALDTLISALNSNIQSLQDVMGGVVEHQKAQKSDTTKAMARIQDPDQYKQISSIAENSIGDLGADIQIKSLKALANGLVSVEGAFKNVDGEWEGFTVKVNESNKAVDLAVNKYSAFAKVMTKLEEEMEKANSAVDDNNRKLSPDSTAILARATAMDYDDEGKEVTVQYKDSQRYTVSLKENIGGLQKEVFQTFDDSIKDFNERTTVTVSNKTASAIRETNNLIEENAQKVGNADLLTKYNTEYKKLLNMNQQYRYVDNLGDDEIDAWNKQITLVQTLGNEVSSLIKQQQKLDSQSGVATSAKKLQEYQTKADNIFKGLDFDLTSEIQNEDQQTIVDTYSEIIEQINLLKKSHSVLTDTQIAELNNLISTLDAVAGAYKNTLGSVFTSKRGEALSKFNLEKATLQADINIPDSFNEKLKNIKTAIESAADDDALKIAINDWKTLQNEIKQAAIEQDLYIKKTKDIKPDEFTKNKTAQVNALDKYTKDLKNANYGVENLSTKLEGLKNQLLSIDNQASLDAWITEFEALQTVVDNAKAGFVKQNDTIIDKVQKQLSGSFNRLDPSQQITLLTTYSEVMGKLAQQRKNVQNGQAVTLAGIQAITKALQEQIEVQLKANKATNTVEQTQKKNRKFGSTAEINVTAKHNSLINAVSNKQFENSSSITAALKGYEDAYEKFTNELKNLRNSNDQVTKEEEVTFKRLTTECNNAAAALEKVIKNTMELKGKQANTEDHMLGGDFVDDEAGRAAALSEFVKKFYDINVATSDFRNNYNEVVFAVDKGNGTFTQMTATFTAARNEIVALAGDTNKVQGKFESFIDGVKNRLQSLSQYFIATIGIYDVWNVVKQGINHVKEIDSALTELKKVTDETDASYAKFLQDMSKTGSVIGATVKDLITMAADWSRLGYSMEEAGKLAESTAVLLNVSEFKDATEASEALISTMQAFQYTADESQHVVDILNEVGNNYAVSSDGIATALQDSASALMEGGNSLEQAVALIAAANRVVQDPNSVGSALRTISLRLRGTSVEVLEELGEETDGVVESTSKLQEKIKALSGVDILTNSGDYKDTYTILKEIGTVWENMSDIDQAALLELMAGKNRANTLSAILSNMKDLEGAYNDALNAEGSALKENEAYLDSIQGRIDLFNNSVQTMWMNFIDSEVIKFLVNVGTGLVKLVDAIGLIPTGAGLFAGWKFAAAELEQAFGKTSISTKELKKNINDYINQQKTAGQTATATAQEVVVAEQQKTAAQTQSTAAATAEGNASVQNAAKNTVQTAASKEVAKAKTEEANALTQAEQKDISEGQSSIDNATKNTIQAGSNTGSNTEDIISTGTHTVGILGKIGTGVKAVGLALGKAALVMLAVKAATWAIGKAWEALDKNVINRAKHIREEVEELKETYESAKETFDSNMDALTASSDSRRFATLQDEFNMLAKGVDRYGNNISLTSDQYERYKAICEQIVGIQPSIAAGYDSAAAAIGNNVDILKELIELQQIQARQNAADRVSDENFGKFAEDAYNNYETALYDNASDLSKARSLLNAELTEIFRDDRIEATLGFDFGYDFNMNGSDQDDYMSYVLEKLGYENPYDIVSTYWNEAAQAWDTGSFISDYYNEIYTNAAKFGPEYQRLIIDSCTDIETTIRHGQDAINRANDDLVDDFLVVPQSEEAYAGLNDASKKFITNWIKNGSIFKMDAIGDDTELALQARDKIVQFINDLASDDFTTEFDGKQITGQDLLDQMYDLDPSKVDWTTYQNQIGDYISAIWNLIGGENNQYGFTDTLQLSVALGFNFKEDALELQRDRDLIAKRLDISVEEMNEFLAGMTAAEIQAFYRIDWNNIDPNDSNTKEEILNIVRNEAKALDDIVSVQTYSVLVSGIENYNEVLTQTSEIILDNTEVTQEYKDSLVALGISTEDLEECFDETNPLIVKNAKKLNDLVKSTKKTTAQNIKLAKSQARLQYLELYKKMQALTNGRKVENAATLAQINAIYAEMTALQKTIAKYSILEHQLLGAASAYDRLAEAQEIDAAIDYGSKAEEMVSVLANAFNTAELGTEAAQVAIDGLIPDGVIDKAKTLDEQMQDIYSYFTTGPVSELFTIEFDDNGGISSIEMTKENVEAFTESLIGSAEEGAVFQGTWDEFTLNPAITTLEEFADACGITEEVAFAFLTELERYDISWLGGDGTTLLDQLMGDNFEYRAQKCIEQLAELEYQMANGQISADEYATRYAEISAAQDENTQKIIENARAWASATNEVGFAQRRVEEITQELNDLRASGATEQEIQMKTTELENASAMLGDALKKKYALQEPTEMTLTLALDEVTRQIDQFKADNSVLLTKVQIEENELGQHTYTVNAGINLNEAEKAELDAYMGLLNDQHTITVLADENPEDSSAELDKVKTAAEAAREAIENIPDPNINTQPAINAINNLQTAIENIKGTTVDIYETTHKKTVYSIGFGSSKGADDVNGTAHANGTAFKNGSWGAPKTETALVGELGPELLVRGDRWTTIGENGAEFTQVKKGDIIFNHRQTEQLLKNGYVTGRGKIQGGSAFVSGSAYAGINTWDNAYGTVHKDYSNTGSLSDAASDLSSAADDISDSADEFEETFDWIEIRLEEINERLDLRNAQLENASNYSQQNAIINDMIALNEKLYDNLIAGANKYYSYARTLLARIPSAYREAAQNGAIAIEEFVGEVDEKTLEAIQDYRDWVQKGADATQQAEEVLTTIRDLAIQKFDNAYEAGDVRATVEDSQTEKLQNAVDYDEERGLITSDAYYIAMMENSNKKIEYLTNARNAMQKELDAAVNAGQIVRGSNEWYELIDQMYQVDAQIDEAVIELEEFQNAINNIYWDNFDELINRLNYLKDETQSLIDLMDSEDMVITPESENGWSAEDVTWTDEGLASLGLYAQQMEIAEYQSRQYAQAIDDLNDDYIAGKYSESEYLEKLNELTSAQYDSIEAYYDAQDAIKGLNETRVESIKEGIEKEVEAYEELIEKKKELLSSEKDLHDFQLTVAEQQKDIADIERKLAALAADNSASARAQRARLEAELAEANATLQETYYDRSVEDQQTALDKELESFQEEKDAEITKWEEYLEDVKQVVADSLMTVQANASGVYDTLSAKANEYNLTLSEAIMLPWQDGAFAISDYQTVFDTAMSSTTEQLEEIRTQWQDIINLMAKAAGTEIQSQQKENEAYVTAGSKPSNSSSSNNTVTKQPTVKVGGKVNAGSAKIYSYVGDPSGEKQYYSNDPVYKVLAINGNWVQVRHHKLSTGVTGWFKKNQVKAYAKGTKGVNEDQLALIDELGDELIMHADGSGKLAFLSKGSAVVPHDISENLMQLGELNPQDVLDRNRPVVSAPHITNNNIELNVTFGEVVHIDHVDNNAVPNLAKTVEKQIDKYMKGLNAEIRKYTR